MSLIGETVIVCFKGECGGACYRCRNASLEAALREVRDLLDGYVDVTDGDYGQPAPNKAMQAQQAIDDALGTER